MIGGPINDHRSDNYRTPSSQGDGIVSPNRINHLLKDFQVTGTKDGTPSIQAGLTGLYGALAETDPYDLGPAGKLELYDTCYEIFEEHHPAEVVEERFNEYEIKRPEYRVAQIRSFDKIEAEEVEWLWTDRLPVGKSSELIGNPSVGKSFLSLHIIARLSKGEAFPDEEGTDREAINCLIVSAEDAPEDTIYPRLKKAGADMERVFFLDGFKFGTRNQTLNLKLEAHVRHLEKAIKEFKIGLLVLDPLNAYLGSTNSHNDASVRELLTPLNKVLRDNRCTLLAIRHMIKDEQIKAIHRAGGSVGFTANSRASFVVCEVPDSDERAVICIKSNLAPMPDHIGYTIKSDPNDPSKALFEWSSKPPDVELGDLLRPDSTSEESSDRSETETWLVALLENGHVPSNELFEKAKSELDVGKSTVKRAKVKLKGTDDEIEAIRLGKDGGERGDGEWCWRLLRGSDPPDDSEDEPLKETQSDQGDSASDTSSTVQEGQPVDDDPLKGLPF